MLGRPHRVGRLRLLVDASVCVAENKAKVEVGICVFHQQHFGACFGVKQSLALEQHLRAVGLIQSEIWGVAAISSWPGVVERDGLVLDLQLTIFYLLGQLFKATAKTGA